jgi:hypothetical protein
MAITDYVEIVTNRDDKGNPTGGYIVPLEVAAYIKGEITEPDGLEQVEALHGQRWVNFIERVLAAIKAA